MIREKTRSEIDSKYKWDIDIMIDDFDLIYNEALEISNKIKDMKGSILSSRDSLSNYLKLSEDLNILSENLYIYSHMLCDQDTNDNNSSVLKLKSEKLFEIISEDLSFVTVEILNGDYKIIKSWLTDELEIYKYYFENLFREKEHVLSDKEEVIISLANNAFGNTEKVFYNLNNSDISFESIKDEDGNLVELTNSNYSKYIISKNRDVRKNAFEVMYKYYASHKNTLASSLVGSVKENIFMSKVRKFESPLSMSLYEDNIDIEVYDNLISSVHKNNKYMYEYMEIKRKMLNLSDFHMYDVYVSPVKEDLKDITFNEAKDIIFEALKPLGNQYLIDLEKAFDESWIDIYPSVGKKSGAYSWGSYSSKPYLLLNYINNMDSVSTMIHELGHSMHSFYSNKQDYVNHSYPIFLAEIASTVNEVLLNDYLYKNAKTKETKIYYLVELLDKFKGTIFRQTMFAEFEKIIYGKELSGISLTEKEISDTYYNLNKMYFGDSVISDEEIRYEWSRIPHFYTPFYVYKYATGLSAAVKIANDIINGKNKDEYLEFLSSGGSNYPLNILNKVGVDMTKDAVDEALNVFKQKLDELKKLIEE